jgi:cell division cycle protein 20 (cofactor of APC complex)
MCFFDKVGPFLHSLYMLNQVVPDWSDSSDRPIKIDEKEFVFPAKIMIKNRYEMFSDDHMQNELFGAPLPRWKRKSAQTPNKPHQQDRFVPRRMTPIQQEVAQLKTKTQIFEDDYTRGLDQRLFDGELGNSKILSFSEKPKPPPPALSQLRTIYSQKREGSLKLQRDRAIRTQPDRILDVPNLVDDFYLNVLDWSNNGVIGIGLTNEMYLLDYARLTSSLLFTLNPEIYISSVSWGSNGQFLSAGLSNGSIQIWDVEKQKLIRTLRSHEHRVISLAWNSHMLSSGAHSIVHHDVRIKDHLLNRQEAHSQEVCGLKWSPCGTELASGGNDNAMYIWNKNNLSKPSFECNEHTSAVKAMAWSPSERHVLITGGGASDRKIRVWNTTTKSCTKSVDTGAQVCSLLWSKTDGELISSQGFSSNSLVLWKYPTLKKQAELFGHKSRVLYTAQSPNGSIVVSASGDETMRFWNIFSPSVEKKTNGSPLSIKDMNIR